MGKPAATDRPCLTPLSHSFTLDIVVGFNSQADADQFRVELTERMKKFHLELHPEKTRLLEFGPFAIDQRQWRGEGKPETFNFLGFTHICVKKRSNGRFTVLRQTIRKRLQTKLNEVKAELQRRMHEPIPEQGKWRQAVVRGHIRYYGVPRNQNALWIFRFQVGRLWHRALSRRSQNGRVLWDRMRRLLTRWLPFAFRLPSLSSAAHGRRHLRQEPDAGKPLVRIRGGGCEQSRSLLRLNDGTLCVFSGAKYEGGGSGRQLALVDFCLRPSSPHCRPASETKKM